MKYFSLLFLGAILVASCQKEDPESSKPLPIQQQTSAMDSNYGQPTRCAELPPTLE